MNLLLYCVCLVCFNIYMIYFALINKYYEKTCRSRLYIKILKIVESDTTKILFYDCDFIYINLNTVPVFVNLSFNANLVIR